MSSKNQPLSFPFPPIKTIIKPSNSDALLLLDDNSHLSAFLSPKKKKKKANLDDIQATLTVIVISVNGVSFSLYVSVACGRFFYFFLAAA